MHYCCLRNKPFTRSNDFLKQELDVCGVTGSKKRIKFIKVELEAVKIFERKVIKNNSFD